MHPILFKFGPVTVRSYGVMIVLGILAGLIWTKREFAKKKLPDDLLYDLLIAVIALGVVGARLLYVALNWETYRTNLIAIPMIWADGGLSFHGAVAGGILAGFWLARRYKISFWKVADAVAPALALGHFFGRIGCFLNGCCYGIPTTMPWGVKFHNLALGIETLPSHPTQLYEAAGLLVLFFLLSKLSKQPPYEGAVFIWWLIFYSVLRFTVEYWRAGATANLVHGLTEAQWLSLVLFSAAFAYHRWKRMGRGSGSRQ